MCSGESGEKMVLESADGTLGTVGTVSVGCDELHGEIGGACVCFEIT